jgi:hypothetical protein
MSAHNKNVSDIVKNSGNDIEELDPFKEIEPETPRRCRRLALGNVFSDVHVEDLQRFSLASDTKSNDKITD